MLVLIGADWIIWEKSDNKTRINQMGHLNYLNFADDVCTMSHNRFTIQDKLPTIANRMNLNPKQTRHDG